MDDDADRYEIELRRRDARRNTILGLALLAISVGMITAWIFLVQNVSGRIRTGLMGFAIAIGLAGVLSIVAGVKKQGAAAEMERALGAKRP